MPSQFGGVPVTASPASQQVIDVFDPEAGDASKPKSKFGGISVSTDAPKSQFGGVPAQVPSQQPQSKFGGVPVKEASSSPLQAGAANAYAPFKPIVDRVLAAAEDVGKAESRPKEAPPKLENPRTGLPFKSAMNIDTPLRIATDIGAATPGPVLAGAGGEAAETLAARAAGVPDKKAKELGADTGDLMAMAGGVATKDMFAKEKISSPAIKDGDKIYTGKNHEEIRQSMPEGSNKGAEADTGFVTDKGRFVSREEADKIAKAQGQFKGEKKEPGALHSEELKNPAPEDAKIADYYRKNYIAVKPYEYTPEMGAAVILDDGTTVHGNGVIHEEMAGPAYKEAGLEKEAPQEQSWDMLKRTNAIRVAGDKDPRVPLVFSARGGFTPKQMVAVRAIVKNNPGRALEFWDEGKSLGSSLSDLGKNLEARKPPKTTVLPTTGETLPKSKIFSDDQAVASTKPVSSVRGVADRLFQSRGALRADYKEFSQWANQFKDVPKDFWQKALDHLDDPKGVPLTEAEQKIFDRSVGLMRDEIDAARKEMKASGFDPKYLEEASDSMGGAIRQRKGSGTPMDRLTGEKGRAPEGGRSLSRSAGTFKGRNMRALIKDGERQVVYVDKDGSVYRADKKGDPVGHVDEDGKFQGEGKLGEATRKEIEKATDGAIQYHDNAFGVYGTALLQARRALRSVRVLEEIKKSPDFNMIAHGPLTKGDIPKGWKEIPDAPEFRGYRFEPRYAEEIEDFLHGAKFDAGELNKLDRLNRFMLNTTFWANPYHAFNMNNAFTVTKGLGGLAKDLPGTTADLLKSIKSVATRDKFNMQQVRAGVPMRGLDAAGEDFQKKVLDIMGVKMRQDPQGFTQWAKQFGFNQASDFYQYVSKMSHKATFAWQDVLQQTLERGYMRQGLSQAQATEKIAKTFMNYRTPARVADQRWVGQALQGQAWLNFPKYAYGRLNGMYNILNDVVRQRDLHALDQLITIGVLYEFGQHVINPFLKDLTGNDAAESSEFGYEVFPELAAKTMGGQRTIGQDFQSLASPGYMVQAYDLARGVQPYIGKALSLPGESPSQVGFDYANQFADKFAPVQKYNQLQRGQIDGNDLLLEQLGVKFPTDPQDVKAVRRGLKTRNKYGNPTENLFDEVTGQ
jgi:hypothetical protein